MKLKRTILLLTTLILLMMSSASSFGAVQKRVKNQEDSRKALGIVLQFDTPAHYPLRNHGCEIKATTVCSHLTSTFHLFRTQEIFCLFEILFEVSSADTYRPHLPVTLQSFYKNLFHSIISPNAP